MTQMKQVHPHMLEQLRERAAQAVQLKAEVARLRKELERMRQSRDRSEQGKLDERTAHEATKARVAELERNQMTPAALAEFEMGKELRDQMLAALDQVRGLLERMPEPGEYISLELRDAFEAWLHAHPATATAVTDSRAEQYGTPLSSGDVLHATATPAATGADIVRTQDSNAYEQLVRREGAGNVSDEKRKMFECMELLSDELCQTQAFILRALSRAGLALVPAADVLKPEERAVLEAVAAIPGSELRSRGNWYGYAKKVGDAEAARRAAKEAKGG